MKNKTITVGANSLKVAREYLKKQIPQGLELLSEEVLSDGLEHTSRGVGETVDAALNRAQDNTPPGAKILKRAKKASPANKRFTIEAFGEDEARTKIESAFGDKASIQRVVLIDEGSNGFLGIGKIPDTFVIDVRQLAVVEITYREKAKIQAVIGKPKPKPKCHRCGQSVDILVPVTLADSETGGRAIAHEVEVCNTCFMELASMSQGIRYG
jgi:hypothetical protein